MVLQGSNVRFNYYCTAGNLNRCMGIFGDFSAALNCWKWEAVNLQVVCWCSLHRILGWTDCCMLVENDSDLSFRNSWHGVSWYDVSELGTDELFVGWRFLRWLHLDGTLDALSNWCWWFDRSLQPWMLLNLPLASNRTQSSTRITAFIVDSVKLLWVSECLGEI